MGGDQGGFIIPKLILAIGILGGGIYLLNKLIISQYIFDDKKLAKSLILAVFSATAFWSVWFGYIIFYQLHLFIIFANVMAILQFSLGHFSKPCL